MNVFFSCYIMQKDDPLIEALILYVPRKEEKNVYYSSVRGKLSFIHLQGRSYKNHTPFYYLLMLNFGKQKKVDIYQSCQNKSCFGRTI